jgi:hypothetical protein
LLKENEWFVTLRLNHVFPALDFSSGPVANKLIRPVAPVNVELVFLFVFGNNAVVCRRGTRGGAAVLFGAPLPCGRCGSQDLLHRIARDGNYATILHDNIKCDALYIITGVPVDLKFVCGVHNSIFLFHAIARKGVCLRLFQPSGEIFNPENRIKRTR